MTSKQGGETPPKPSPDGGRRMIEIRVLVPDDVVRKMDIYRTLVGQTKQTFVRLALQRHLELYSHLMLDLSPEGQGGVGFQIVGKDVPRRALPRRAAGDAGDGGDGGGDAGSEAGSEAGGGEAEP